MSDGHSRGGSGARIGVDIGGTFTDIVISRAGSDSDGELIVRKVSSTPDDPGRAVVDGLREALASSGTDPASVTEVVHGTTVGSNTILQKVGARTGLLSTRGFRDVLEIGRIRTPDMFDLDWDKPAPLVPRRYRLEAVERIGADGEIVTPLTEADVARAADVFHEAEIESVAICFLNSYTNPAHEQAAEAILRDRLGNINITASYAVLPEIKEYERTSTTVVNAYIQPALKSYIALLEAGLRDLGIDAPLLIVASNGAVMSARAVCERPVFAVGSGPAAGVMGAARLGTAIGTDDLIVFDMGGTTAKASLIEDGDLTLTGEYEFRDGISTPSRFIKAGGYMLKAPTIDIAEVGSGAGSLAWIDAGGMLNVGPQSAGAHPGPVCYGLGGDTPAVTDSNVVLGHLNPEALAGGSLKIDAGAAGAAIERDLSSALSLDRLEAAHGIRQVVNANMARAIRSVTIERGRDPRDYAMIAFGGSGPVHAADIADALDIRRVIVPILPGVFTALGMLTSDVAHHLVRAFRTPVTAPDIEGARASLSSLSEDATGQLVEEGYATNQIHLRRQADLRYVGQDSEITVDLPDGDLTADGIAALKEGFEAAYLRDYGHVADDTVEIANFRIVATGLGKAQLDFAGVRATQDETSEDAGQRSVLFDRTSGPQETAIHRGATLPADGLVGPAVIELYDSTIVVPPGWRATADAIGNTILDRE